MYLNDKRNGYGMLKFIDGRVYEGSWVDDKMKGQGAMMLPDGDVKSGNWENNRLTIVQKVRQEPERKLAVFV